MSNFEHELATQPEMWRRAAEIASTLTVFPAPGTRVAFVGCGTSLYVAQAAAAYRSEQMLGESDAFPASEVPPGRKYDAVVVISRSGTTTEVLDATASLVRRTRVLAITAVDDSPLTRLVADRIVLSFADEQSIVQTRFATSTLSLLLASCGWDVGASAARAEVFLGEPSPEEVDTADHFVFLGRGVAAALGERGRAQVPRGARCLDRVLSHDGVPPRPDLRRQRAVARMDPRQGRAEHRRGDRDHRSTCRA